MLVEFGKLSASVFKQNELPKTQKNIEVNNKEMPKPSSNSESFEIAIPLPGE